MNRITRITLSTVLLMSGLTLSAQNYPINPGTSCGNASAVNTNGYSSCGFAIGTQTIFGVQPNVSVSWFVSPGPVYRRGSLSFETFQTESTGPYWDYGNVTLSAPKWGTVADMRTGAPIVNQMTDLTIYGYGDYAPASGEPPCQVANNVFTHCWKAELTLHFGYYVQNGQGGTKTTIRVVKASELSATNYY